MHTIYAPNILVHVPGLENLGANRLSKAVRFRQTHRTNGQPASTTSRKKGSSQAVVTTTT